MMFDDDFAGSDDARPAGGLSAGDRRFLGGVIDDLAPMEPHDRVLTLARLAPAFRARNLPDDLHERLDWTDAGFAKTSAALGPTGPTALSAAPSAAEAGLRGRIGLPAKGAASANDAKACILVSPTGDFKVVNADPRYDPAMAKKLSDAISDLNSQGIVPTITEGYRTPKGQANARNNPRSYGKSGSVSWHQVGRAVDFGPNNNRGFDGAIRKAMEKQGLYWGGMFRDRDPPHYQSEPVGPRPTAAEIAACLQAATRR